MPHVRARLIAFASTLTLAACATPAAVTPETDPRATLMSEYLQGRYADLTNAPEIASQNYLSALKQAPDDAVLLEGAVDSALVSGEVERAGAAASLGRARGVDSPLARITLATLALREGRFGAVRTLLPTNEGPPVDRLAARVLRAWALAGDGKTDQAIASLDDAGEGAPFSLLFDYQRALILQRAGRNDDAIKAYESGLAGGLRTPPSILEYGALLRRLGRTDDAIAMYQRATRDGDEPSISAALAQTRAGKPPPASLIDRPAAGAAMGMMTLSALLLGQTDPDFYLPYVTLALALDPSLDGARLVYAEGMQELHLWQASAAALDKVAPSSPFYERAQVQRVFLLRLQDDKDGALALARATVEQTHGRLSRLALADLLRDTEQWSEAVPLYDVLIRESRDDAPESWRLYFARGACLERLGRWREAELDLKKALTLSPDQPDVLNYLGYSWIDQGLNLKEGMKMIERAVSLDPDAGYIVDSLGWAYFKLGDYGPAVEHLERAVELSPDDPTLNEHLGDAYWREGRRAEARFQWTRSLTLKPTAADAAHLRDKLGRGLPPEPARRTVRAEAKH